MSHLHEVPAPAPRELVVLSAGMSEQSSSSLLAGMVVDALRETGEELADAHVTVVELRPLAHALTDALLTGFASGELAQALAAVAGADGLVAVTPVHSASYSALFKAFFDVLEDGALDGMPVLMAATAGSARHSLVLDHAVRPLFGYLRAVTVPTGVFAASEDWGSGEDIAVAALRRRVARAAGELALLVAARPRVEKLDSFDRDIASMGSFEDLLRGS
jgi:FMN reductase